MPRTNERLRIRTILIRIINRSPFSGQRFSDCTIRTFDRCSLKRSASSFDPMNLHCRQPVAVKAAGLLKRLAQAHGIEA